MKTHRVHKTSIPMKSWIKVPTAHQGTLSTQATKLGQIQHDFQLEYKSFSDNTLFAVFLTPY